MAAPSKWERDLTRLVEAAGGSVRRTRDGHLAVYDARGRFLIKQRTSNVGGTTGKTRERVVRGIVSRIERSRREDG